MKINVTLFSKVYCLDVMQAFICPDECNMYWSVQFLFLIFGKTDEIAKKDTEDRRR